MSDDLVERLYDRRVCSPAQNSCRNNWVLDLAANRIAELEAQLRKSALQELSVLGQEIEVTAELEQAEAKIVELEATSKSCSTTTVKAACSSGSPTFKKMRKPRNEDSYR